MATGLLSVYSLGNFGHTFDPRRDRVAGVADYRCPGLSLPMA
jgi:hypothetical protein